MFMITIMYGIRVYNQFVGRFKLLISILTNTILHVWDWHRAYCLGKLLNVSNTIIHTIQVIFKKITISIYLHEFEEKVWNVVN